MRLPSLDPFSLAGSLPPSLLHPGAAGPTAAAGLGICICRPHSEIHADLLADSVLETRLHDVLYQEEAIPCVTEWDVKGQETGSTGDESLSHREATDIWPFGCLEIRGDQLECSVTKAREAPL
ncbi:hypothetical protein O3P69_018465 [Scylla paramamosain]|uniref:Uncharacterized protein n=1 Tax=Scylla paramamosain TaxID=85552 RepID=A0AAW0T3I2_SCYPA